jgi:hypothetical protein
MDDLKRKKRTRGGHRSFNKKTLGEVKGLLSNPELERETLYNRKSSLEEQLGVIQTLDNDTLKVLEGTDETEESSYCERNRRGRSIEGGYKSRHTIVGRSPAAQE